MPRPANGRTATLPCALLYLVTRVRRAPSRNPPHRHSSLCALVLVDVCLRVPFSVVRAGLDVNVLPERREVANPEIRRTRNQTLAFREHRPLYSITVYPLFEIEPGRLVCAKTDPRSLR